MEIGQAPEKSRSGGSYAFVYVDHQGIFSFTYHAQSVGINEFLKAKNEFKDFAKEILFRRFPVNKEQADILLSNDFDDINHRPFEKVKDRANSLIDKLKQAG